LNGYGTVLITNNIFYTNAGTPSVFYSNGGNSDAYMSWGTNLFYDGVGAPIGGVGNVINKDPLFMNVSSGDFTLQPNSPAIDAGITVPGLNLNDFLSNPRPVGVANDLGAFEYAP